jgi:hypothetical protein
MACVLPKRLEDRLWSLLQSCREEHQYVKTVDVYGCKRWEECDSVRVSPPYDPRRPKKCEKHRVDMKTFIVKRESHGYR